jgi:ethanolamine utilization protein EutN
MQLAKVLGSVVATVKHESLTGVRLLLIQPQDENGVPDGDAIVAADPLQAGAGDIVEWTTGREAALALPVTYSPVDASVISIVDHAWSDKRYLE